LFIICNEYTCRSYFLWAFPLICSSFARTDTRIMKGCAPFSCCLPYVLISLRLTKPVQQESMWNQRNKLRNGHEKLLMYTCKDVGFESHFQSTLSIYLHTPVLRTMVQVTSLLCHLHHFLEFLNERLFMCMFTHARIQIHVYILYIVYAWNSSLGH
jgi:hypothetical protein